MRSCCCRRPTTRSRRRESVGEYRFLCLRVPIFSIIFPAAIISAVVSAFFITVFYAEIFQWTTFIYLIGTVMIYWFLFAGIQHRRSSLLIPYILYELIATVGHVVLFIILIFNGIPLGKVANVTTTVMPTRTSTDDTSSSAGDITLIELDILFSLLLVGVGVMLKSWALSVVLLFYQHLKYLNTCSQLAIARYTNGRGVQMNANNVVFRTFPADVGGNVRASGEVFSGIDYPSLPTYEDVMSTQKSRNETNVM